MVLYTKVRLVLKANFRMIEMSCILQECSKGRNQEFGVCCNARISYSFEVYLRQISESSSEIRMPFEGFGTVEIYLSSSSMSEV